MAKYPNGNTGDGITSEDQTRQIVVRHEAEIRAMREDIKGIYDLLRNIAAKQESKGIQWGGVSVAVALSLALASAGWLMTRLALQPVQMVAEQATADINNATIERDRHLLEDLKSLRSDYAILSRRMDEEREGRWVRDAQRNETERSRLWEQVRENAGNIGKLQEQLNEVETQFNWATDAMNSAMAHSDRLDAIMWKKVFGEDLPALVGNGVGPEGKTRK